MILDRFTAALRLVLVLLAAPTSSHAASFTPLGTLGGLSNATGISDDGSVVAGISVAPGGFRGYRWTKAGMVDLGVVAGARDSLALGVSADGSVVYGQSSGGTTGRRVAVTWTAGTGIAVLPDVDPSSNSNEAISASADGSIIVGRSAGQATAWSTAGASAFAPFFSHANAITPDGRQIVGWTGSNGWRQIDRGAVEFLPIRLASDVSDDGSTIVGRALSSSAGLWTELGGPVSFGVLNPTDHFSHAVAVSGDGSIVVGFSGTNVSEHAQNRAFIWTEQHGMRDLQQVLASDYGLVIGPSWSLVTASAITPDGLWIAGTAATPSGALQAFVVSLPEPGIGGLLSITVLVALQRRPRSHTWSSPI